MAANHHNGPPLGTLLSRTASTGLGALENRGEIFMLEVQEEKARLVGLILRAFIGLFLAIMTALLLTAAVIFLVLPEHRVYAAGGFMVLYLAGSIWAMLSIRKMLRQIPFAESLAQLRKDRELLEAFE